MSFVWVLIGAVAVLALLSGGNKGGGKSRSSGGPVRIDHWHYADADEYECSACGARFSKAGPVCPKCGARFSGTEDDETEFIEEMEILDDDDDD